MRILALSDIHNAYISAGNILDAESEFDIILVSGDITTHGSASDAEKAIDRFKKYGKTVLAIAGNMDSPEIDNVLVDTGCSINGKGIMIGDIGFFGVSAAPVSPLHTPYEISEDEVFQRAENGYKDIANAKWKFFVPHAPPYNTRLDKIFSGNHVGSISVRKFIDRRQPDIVVCGHIHEARGTDVLGISKIINCGTAANGYYAIIDIGNSIHMENRG